MKERLKIAIALGDQAGIGAEITAKALKKLPLCFTPILVGSKKLFLPYEKMVSYPIVDFKNYNGNAENEDVVFFMDIPCGDDICLGKITADSGKLMYESLITALNLQKEGKVDAVIMAPITKQALHGAGYNYSSEFEIFASYYKSKSVSSVIKCQDIFRSTVVGHVPFAKIVENLTSEKIAAAGRNLAETMKKFMPAKKVKIAVAALNPHAGENGLFGDEEGRIITPAINILEKEGISAEGPCPADTVFLKTIKKEANGIVFMYHDQGNIAMKSSFFGNAVLIYCGVPAPIYSVGHGSALDIAGKGTADETNMSLCIETACRTGKALTR